MLTWSDYTLWQGKSLQKPNNSLIMFTDRLQMSEFDERMNFAAHWYVSKHRICWCQQNTINKICAYYWNIAKHFPLDSRCEKLYLVSNKLNPREPFFLFRFFSMSLQKWIPPTSACVEVGSNCNVNQHAATSPSIPFLLTCHLLFGHLYSKCINVINIDLHNSVGP